MDSWMAARGRAAVWLLADSDDARAFYLSCRFMAQHPAPAYMVRSARRRD